jgi:hypothetical protein
MIEPCLQLAIKLTQVTSLASSEDAEVKASDLQNSQVPVFFFIMGVDMFLQW